MDVEVAARHLFTLLFGRVEPAKQTSLAFGRIQRDGGHHSTTLTPSAADVTNDAGWTWNFTG
jgi:hypothetical protein